ncbi:MAG: ECF-type sigma factor [Planctomycetota bacterium]
MSSEITEILDRITDGHRDAVNELIPLVYEQMKRIAANALSTGGSEACNPTELVHETYIRLIGNEKLAWQNRSHFFGACSTVIRRILVDHARAIKSAKRGSGKKPVQLIDANDVAHESSGIDLVELDDALAELAKLAPRQVKLVELRYFGGLTEAEAAEVLDVSRRTVSGDWAMAKAWLKNKLD